MVQEDSGTVMSIRNLLDAGCEPEQIETFLKYKSEGRTGEQLRLLKCHRSVLLEKVHESQKMIDCLDFLVFTIQKETGVGPAKPKGFIS